MNKEIDLVFMLGSQEICCEQITKEWSDERPDI